MISFVMQALGQRMKGPVLSLVKKKNIVKLLAREKKIVNSGKNWKELTFSEDKFSPK